MAELQESLRRLEQGDLSLDESLAEYQRGLRMMESCYNYLEDAERKIEIMKKREDGGIERRNFEHEAWKPRD